VGNRGKPTAFDDPRTMLGGSGEIYYAKLRRGGMGTGMPGFGPLLTPEETWMLVDYLWTFVFERDQSSRAGFHTCPEGAGKKPALRVQEIR
jgi:mono/diheme cytochrome c family protein